MSAVDRLSDGYLPDFDLDMQVGKQGELFVADIVDMLSNGTGEVEVKTDEMVSRTGNVYIEYACRRRDGWKQSGIATTQAKLWAFVLPANVLIVAPVEAVRELARSEWVRPASRKECIVGSHPNKGVVIPVGRFVMQLYSYEIGAA